ncbi:MAG: hypothetical protein IPP73_12600 [Chitinophagaceae bacterium]|nr:hypothetical protein [Chitinophagaceae bacterium]
MRTIGGTSATFDGTSLITVSLTEGKQSNIGNVANYINRYWTITPSGTFDSPDYDAAFTYIQSDVIGSEGAVKSAKYNSSWTFYALANQASNLLTVAGATSFSDYTAFSDLSVSPSAQLILYVQAEHLSVQMQMVVMYLILMHGHLIRVM